MRGGFSLFGGVHLFHDYLYAFLPAANCSYSSDFQCGDALLLKLQMTL